MREACLHWLVEAQARRTPDAVALESGDDRLRYQELDAAANAVAHELRRHGVGPEVLVGVFLRRGVRLPVAMLGILKAGGGYVPFDPDLPPQRLGYLLEDSAVRLMVTEESLLERLPPRVRTVLCPGAGVMPDPGPPTPTAHPPATAYVMYTSGSTGRPKGVVVEHRSVARFARTQAALYELTAADRVYQFASAGFDTYTAEIFPTLASGATVVMRSPGATTSVQRLVADLTDRRVTVVDLPTAFWHELCATADGRVPPAAVRLLVIGGEKASRHALARWRRHADDRVRLLNTYGPTEATVSVCAADLTTVDDADDPPIGIPSPGVTAHVLDAGLRPVPAGERGELCLGGPCVARGYLGQPSLTAERFVPDPFGPDTGARLYRTGDLVRVGPDGQLQIAGRTDDQVKIRGFRVEPAEIETVLRGHPGVHEAVVAAGEEAAAATLVAYLVPAGERAATELRELRSYCAQRLPTYMVPSAFVVLPRLPKNANGKIDRGALVRNGGRRLADGADRRPATAPVAAAVAEIWADVLGVAEIGMDDNVLDLGAHSFLFMRVLARIHKRFGFELALPDLLASPTVASLAELVEKVAAERIAKLPDEEVHRLLQA